MPDALPPKPIPDPDSGPYWEALKEERLLVQRCRSCGGMQLYFRAVCRSCWSRDIEELEASGRGTVYSFSISHSVGDPALKAELPYAIVLVDLEEGARVLSRLDGDPDAVRIGDPVVAAFRKIDDEATLLHFRPAEAGG
jgi:uncharacterized OB-fold protein